MSPKFFLHKMREVASFLKIMGGKATKSPETRVEGVKDALNAMDDERKVYIEEMEDAIQEQGTASPKDKVARELGSNYPRDVSAY